MAKSLSLRNHRNSPYVLDRAFVRVHYSAAGTLFRFRTDEDLAMSITPPGGQVRTPGTHPAGTSRR